MPSCTSCTLVSPLAGPTSLSYPSLHWHIGCTGCTMLSYPLPCGGAMLSHYAMPLRCSATVLNHYIMPLRCYATSGSVLCHYGSLPVAVAAADGQRPHALLLYPMLHLHWAQFNPCCTAVHCMHQRHVPGTRCRTVQATQCQCTAGASSTTSSQAGQITGTPAPSQGGRGQMNTSGFDRLLLYKRTTGSDGWISLPTFVWFQLIQVLPSIRL